MATKSKKKNAEHQTAFRRREQMARQRRHEILDHLSPEVQQALAADMPFRLVPNDAGGISVSYRMHVRAEALVTKLAEAQGVSFEDLMNDLSQAILERALTAARAARRN